MLIGINAAAAVRQPRTGVEEYCYQVIKHLTMLPEAGEHRFLLYLPAAARRAQAGLPAFDFSLPENFLVKILNWPLPMWTQLRLASEMLFNKPDALFIPVHILPRFSPKNSVVTIHGLEYEYFPEYYPFWFRKYLRHSTKYAARHARKIIAVSENTKKDLIKFYKTDESKIAVVHHGVEIKKLDLSNEKIKINKPYLLYLGRLELKKNVLEILEAYNILKERLYIRQELVLAGAPGFGYENIKDRIKHSKFKIHELGYVSEAEKWKLLQSADVFLFPSFYEGFGLPVLEAQVCGVPVVAANNSSIPEVVQDSTQLINPKNAMEMAEAIYHLIDDKASRDRLIQLGFENVKKFSWEKCARETLRILTNYESSIDP